MNESQLLQLTVWFNSFVTAFRSESVSDQRNYDLKIFHTEQVRMISEQLADSLELKPEDRALAAAIAICHDVGRFPQYRRYATFNDAVSTNHAALSVTTLKEEGALGCIAADRCNVLLQAVALHNVFILPKDLDPVVLGFSRLIRDADKLDIWRVLIDYCSLSVEERASAVVWELPDTGACSKAALAEVVSGRMLNRSTLATADDFKLLQLSWVFDLNFNESFKILAERGYIETLANLLPCQSGCREVVAVVQSFVKSKRCQYLE